MKKILAVTALVFALGGFSAGAFAQVIVPAGPDSGGTTTGSVAQDPSADVHNGHTDYRLSCPHLLKNPTIDSCRNKTDATPEH